jgi:hypothetical protein
MCTPLEYTEIPKVPFMPRHNRRHLKRSRENNKSNNGNIDNNGIKCHFSNNANYGDRYNNVNQSHLCNSVIKYAIEADMDMLV